MCYGWGATSEYWSEIGVFEEGWPVLAKFLRKIYLNGTIVYVSNGVSAWSIAKHFYSPELVLFTPWLAIPVMWVASCQEESFFMTLPENEMDEEGVNIDIATGGAVPPRLNFWRRHWFITPGLQVNSASIEVDTVCCWLPSVLVIILNMRNSPFCIRQHAAHRSCIHACSVATWRVNRSAYALWPYQSEIPPRRHRTRWISPERSLS